MSTLGWAQFYVVKRRWTIIPLHVLVNGVCTCPRGEACPEKSRGKHPVFSGWTEDNNFTTPEQVAEYWTNNPFMNMGLLTGWKTKTVVIDIDPDKGGFENYDRMIQDRGEGPLPLTLTSRTGSGGLHEIYQIPSGVHIRNGVSIGDYEGIDIRGDGGQIVLPPSLHYTGNRYAWANGRVGTEPLAMLPDDMIDLLQKLSKGGGGGGRHDLDKIIASGVVPDGKRNDVLYAYACRRARQLHVDTASAGPGLDLAVQELTAGVVGFNMMYCKPPLEQDEVMGRVQSSVDWVRKTPGRDLDPDYEAWLIAARDDVVDLGQTSQDDPEADDGDDDGDDPPPPDGGGGGPRGVSPGGTGPAPDADSVPGGTPGNRTLTENGNARRIIDYFGEDIRYTTGMGWHTWSGVKWQQDDESLQMLNYAREIPRKVAEEVPTASIANSTGILDWAAKNSRQLNTMQKSIALARTDPRALVPGTRWNSDPWLLGAQNGVIDLRNGQLLAPNREQYITKRAPLDYDPHANDPRWDVFLDTVTQGDREMQGWLQKVVGYTLTGHMHEEKFFLVYGPKASGKSTLGAVICALLGEYAWEMPSDTITDVKNGAGSGQDSYWLAELAGRRITFISEMPDGVPMKESVVKRITGDTTLQGRHPGEKWFTYKNTVKLWIATNHRPRINDAAIWRRMVAVPFTFNNLAPDASLKPWLLNHSGGLPAALAWAVKGAVRYAADGGLGTCTAVAEATAEYERSEDRLGMFLEEDTRRVEGGSMSLVTLHQAHKQWELERSEGKRNEGGMSRIRFEAMLKDRGYVVTGVGRVAEVQGLALVPRLASTGAGSAAAAFNSMNPNWG